MANVASGCPPEAFRALLSLVELDRQKSGAGHARILPSGLLLPSWNVRTKSLYGQKNDDESGLILVHEQSLWQM